MAMDKITHVATNPYSKDDHVTYSDGVRYQLNRTTGDAPFTGAFVAGWLKDQWRVAGTVRPPKVTRFMAAGTFIPEYTATRTELRIQSPGGAGAGANLNLMGAGSTGVGASGGGGKYIEVYMDGPADNAASVAVSSMFGGSRNTSTAGVAGGTGQTMTFGPNITVLGGLGGAVSSVSSLSAIIYSGAAGATSSTVSAPWTLSLSINGAWGQSQGNGLFDTDNTLAGVNAQGGQSFMGNAAGVNVAVAATAAFNTVQGGAGWGAGGQGVFATGTATMNNPGVGQDGIIIVKEYF